MKRSPGSIPPDIVARAKLLRETPRRTAGKTTFHSWQWVKDVLRREGKGNWSVAMLEDAVRSLRERPPNLSSIERKTIDDFKADHPGAPVPASRTEALKRLRLEILPAAGKNNIMTTAKPNKTSPVASANTKMRQSRTKVPLSTQVQIFFRDGWICRWCHRPTVFGPALKLIEQFVQHSGYRHPLAYYDLRYRRDKAPMLDHLAAVIDHVEAFSKGGAHGIENFVTACNKCNVRKNARQAKDFQKDTPGRPVKGKYGEPQNWDGLVSVFIVLADLPPASLTASEKAWRAALQLHLGV